ncbi:MAG: tetratricopeptide repeat protein [Polyangiales bacterium]
MKIPTTTTVIVDETDASELSEEERQRVIALADRLFDVTHYELLEVDPVADRARILAAFAEIVPRFDPAKHKSLGAARASMLLVYQRLVHARDVLTSSSGRAEYDRYLELRSRARAYEEAVKSGAPPATPRPSTGPTSDPSSSSKLRNATGGVSDATRRNALALQMLSESAKLRAVRPSQIPSPATASVRDLAAVEAAIRTTGPQPDAVSLTETMRRRADELRQIAIKGQIEKLIDQAKVALGEGDPGLAGKHLKGALDLRDTPEIRAMLDDASRQLAESPTAALLEQARFDEDNGEWLSAGRVYEKAYGRRPEPRFAERASNAYVQAGAEVKRALQLAEEASAKLPDSVQTQLTLASACLRDGQLRRARIILERTAKIDPTDRRAEDMLRRI